LGSESITVTTNADAAPNPAYAPLYDGTDMRGAGTVKTVSFSGGTFTTGNIILYNATAAAKNIIITHSGVSGLDTLTVDPASIANLAISGDTPVTTAQISNINITGADAYSNVVTNNNSTNINLTSGGGSNLGSGGGALTAGLFTTTLTKDTAGAATVTVSSDGLTSKSVAITFTDGTGPTVDSWTPTDGVINVSRSINVVITFSEDMATTTLNSTNIKLKKYVAGDGSGEDTFMDVTPSGLRQAVLATSTPLAYGTKYYIYISTGVQDANGNSLQAAWDDTQASKDSHEFTTEAAETTAPTVVSWAPSDDSAGMSISPQIWIKFSEALDTSTVASGNIELRKYSDSSEVAVTYSIQDGDTKVVFNPTANLAYGTQYYFFIGTGLKDVVGNSFAANTWYAAQKAQHEFTTLTDLIIDDYVLEQSNATSTDLYADGWRYRFDISAYNANEEDMFVKFSDWARSGGGGSIAANGNMRMLIDESTGSEIAPMGGFTEDIIVNGSGSIKSYALGNNYADQTLLGVPNTPANITGLDRNGSLSGRQITFYIFTKIPAATPDGLYNTTYGILTQE